MKNSGYHILIMEKNPDIKIRLESLLLKKQFLLVSISNHEEIFQYISKEHHEISPVDLLILDADEAESHTLLEKLKKQKILPLTVLISSSCDKSFLLRFLKLGIHDIFEKPLDVPELKRVIIGLMNEFEKEQFEKERRASLFLVEDQFHAMVHDLNNMLNLVIGNAQLALLSTVCNEPQKDFFSKIVSSTTQIHAMCQSYIMEKNNISRKMVIDLHHWFKKIVLFIREILPDNIQISYSFSEEIPRLELDPYRLQQAILNLCINAIQAMKEGGVLTLHTLLVKNCYGEDPSSDWLKIRIEDTGRGMTPEQSARLFKENFSSKKEGHGLGQRIVKKFIDEMSGRIEVESSPEKGTIIDLFLPCKELLASAPGGDVKKL